MNTALLAQEEEGGTTTNFLIPNATFFVMLLIFLVVLLVIMKWVVPPISEVLREREQLVEKTAANNHQAARELGEAESAFTDELTGARAEAASIREEGRAEGQAVLDEMRGRAREDRSVFRRRPPTNCVRRASRSRHSCVSRSARWPTRWRNGFLVAARRCDSGKRAGRS